MRPHRIECLFMLVLKGPHQFVGVLHLFVILHVSRVDTCRDSPLGQGSDFLCACAKLVLWGPALAQMVARQALTQVLVEIQRPELIRRRNASGLTPC